MPNIRAQIRHAIRTGAVAVIGRKLPAKPAKKGSR